MRDESAAEADASALATLELYHRISHGTSFDSGDSGFGEAHDSFSLDWLAGASISEGRVPGFGIPWSNVRQRVQRCAGLGVIRLFRSRPEISSRLREDHISRLSAPRRDVSATMYSGLFFTCMNILPMYSPHTPMQIS